MDFHYEGVDYSIPGNSQILLSTLIDILNITDESGAKIDVADVADVTFTDESLVKVEQVSGLITYNGAENVDVGEKDFLLTSEASFTSDEVLTITLNSGEEIVVGATDASSEYHNLETSATMGLSFSVVDQGSSTATYDAGTDSFNMQLKVDFQIPHDNIVGDSGEKKYCLEFHSDMKIPDAYLNKDMSAYDSVTGEESFKYKLVKNDNHYEMLVEFTDDYINSIKESGRTIGNNTVTIDISAGTDWLQGDNSLKGHVTEGKEVIVTPDKITYPEGTDGKHDISVSKQFGGYDKTTQKMKYTMVVSSRKGTEGPITVEDGLTVLGGSNITVSNLTVTSVKTGVGNEYHLTNVTTTVTGYTAIPSSDNTHLTLTLPQAVVADGQSDKTVYLIEYEYTLSGVGDDFESNGKNSVTASSGDISKDGEATWSISQAGVTLNKSGQYNAEGDGKITWTINVTNNKNSAIQLQDDALMGLNLSDLTITPGDALNFNSTTGEITIPSGKSYTITYKTTPTIPDATKDTTVTNKATADTKTVEPGVTVPKEATASKELVSVARGDSSAVLTWRVKIHVPKSGFPAGTRFTEKLGFSQDYQDNNDMASFTSAQKDALVNAFKAYFGDAIVEESYTPSGKVPTDAYGNYRIDQAKLVMKLNSAWSNEAYNGKDIFIEYQTSANLTNLKSDNNVYTNTFMLNDVEYPATHSFKERVVKMASPGNAADTTTANADKDNKTLHWYIQVALEQDTRDIVVIDTLPAGLKVTTIRMGDGLYNLVGLVETSEGQWEGETYTDWRRQVPAWNSTYLSDSTASATVSGQTVTISLHAGEVPDYLKANDVFYFYVEAEIDDSQFPVTGTTTKPFTNTASVTVDSEPYSSDDQTQNVTLKSSIVDKTGDSSVWNAQNGAHELSYVVDINPNGGTIINPSGDITLDDHIEYYKTVKDNQGNPHKVSLNLKEGSAKLQRKDSNGQWVDIPATEGWGYILNEDAASPNDNIKAKEIHVFGIPDETVLRFVYTYNVEVDGLPKNASVNLGAIKNSATLHAVEEETSTHTETKDWKNIKSSGTTESTGSLTVVKVQDGNYAIALPDTHFVLEKFVPAVSGVDSAGTWQVIDAIGSTIDGTGEYAGKKVYKTNVNGKLIISSDPSDLGKEGKFQFDTLYRVREYEAHEGYTLEGVNPAAVYFYFGKTVTQQNKETELAGYHYDGASTHADDLLIEADTVYMTNKRLTDTITARKQWNATSLWPSDVAQITLELQKDGATVEKPSSYSEEHNGKWYTADDTGFTTPWENPKVLTAGSPQGMWEKLDIDTSKTNPFEGFRIVETGITYVNSGSNVDLTRTSVGDDQYQWKIGSDGEVLFETFGGKVTNGMGTIVNMSKTKLDVEKSWGTQQLGTDSNIEVTMTLLKEERLYAQNGVIESTLPNWQGNYEPVADMEPIVLDGTVDDVEKTAWQASFEDLDRFRYDDATGRLYEIRYSVQEVVKENGRDITDRYLATTTYANEGTKVTVTNAPNVGKLAVVKDWRLRPREDGEEAANLPAAIYISLERYYTDGDGTVHNDTEFNADHRGIKVTGDDKWVKDSSTTYTWAKLFENLQRKVEVDGTRYEYNYVVKEDNVPGFTKVISEEGIALGDGSTGQIAEATVTNVENENEYKPELIDIHLEKVFTDEAGKPLPMPAGATATFRLYRYVTAEMGTYDMITKELTPTDSVARTEDTEFNSTDNDTQYTHEVSVAAGKTVNTKDGYGYFEDDWTNLPISEIYYNNGSYVKNTYEYYLVETAATDSASKAYTAVYKKDGSKDRPITVESEGTEVQDGNDIKNTEVWNVETGNTFTVRKYWYGLEPANMPGIVFTLKRQSKADNGAWEDVSAFGTSTNGAVTNGNQDYTLNNGTQFKGYLLNQANEWNVSFSGLEDGYRYRVEEMGYLTKRDAGDGTLVDVVIPFDENAFLVNNRYHSTDALKYVISFDGKTFAEVQNIFQQNIPQTEKNYGTVSIGNIPKAEGFQLGLQKKWYSFTGHGGFADITGSGSSGYYTGQLEGEGPRAYIVMQVYQRPYWAFGDHAGEYAGPWIEFKDPIKFNGNDAETISPGFPQHNGGTDWHLQIQSDTSMAHYGYMLNDDGIYEMVCYDYKWIEVSQIPGSDGRTYRTYYEGYPNEPEKHSDKPEYYKTYARQEIENYETGLLKLIKEWKADNLATKIFFSVVDDRGIDIAKKVYESKYKEDYYGVSANDVAYIPQLGKYAFVLDQTNATSANRWELMIRGLDIVKDVDPETHEGFGEVTYTIEEVGCEYNDGTIYSVTDTNYPYNATYHRRVRFNDEVYVGSTAVGNEDGSPMCVSGIQLDSGRAYNESGSLTWVRTVNSDEPTTELTVQKKWPEDAYPGSSVKVVLKLEQRRQATDANNEPLWEDPEKTIPKWVEGSEWQAAEGTNRVSVTLPLDGYSAENAWTYTWKGLPIYKETGELDVQTGTKPHDILWYRVVESSTPGWTSGTLTTTGAGNIVTDISETGATGDKMNPITEVLTNQIDNTIVHIQKQWTNSYAEDEDKSETWETDNVINWPEGYAVDYKVVRHAYVVSATETEATTVDYELGENPDPDAPTSYEQKNVSYTNAFEVEELKKDPFLTGQLSADNPSFDLSAQRKGIIYTTDDDPPAGLAKNTTYLLEYVYEVVETAITTPYGKQSVNLSVIPNELDETGEYVKEGEVVLGDATITNDLTNIEVEKKWTLNVADYTPEGDESVTVQLYRSNERPEGAVPVTPGKITIRVNPLDGQGRKDLASGSITVTVTGDNGDEQDYTLSGPDYTTVTDDLPDIAEATGSDITYTVTVKSVDGTVIETATVNGDGSTAVGGVVTLTAKAVTPPQTFALKFNPNWVIENVWQDGATPPNDESAFANLTLTYGGTSETIRLDNSNQWGKTLTKDLRVADDSGDPITYQLTFNNNNDNKNPAFVNEIQNINPNSFTADDATNGVVTVSYKGIEKQQGGSGGGVEDKTTWSIEAKDGIILSNNRWGIGATDQLTVGTQYTLNMGKPSGLDADMIDVIASGAEGLNVTKGDNWSISFTPTSADEPVVITLQQVSLDGAVILRANDSVIALKRYVPGEKVTITVVFTENWHDMQIKVEGASEPILSKTNGEAPSTKTATVTAPSDGSLTLIVTGNYYGATITLSEPAGVTTFGVTSRSMRTMMKASPKKAAPILRAAAPTKSVTILGENDLTPIDAVAVGDPITLSGDTWTHLWDNLPKVDEDGNAIYYYVKELSANIPSDMEYQGTTYTYDKHNDADAREGYAKVTVTNELEREEPKNGNLKITKTTNPSDSTQVFTFNVTLTAPAGATLAASYPTVTTPKGETAMDGTQAVTSGTAFTVKLKGGDTWQINGLPAGTEYKVTEGPAVGWTNTAKTGDTGSIVADQTKEASFTNVYSETTATPQGVKTLTGRDWNNDSFSFTLTPTGTTLTAIADGKVKLPAGAAADSPYTMNGTATQASGSESVTFNFGDITFLEAGEYTFEMVETAGSTTGITYATNTVTVTVTVPAKNAATGVFATTPTVDYSNTNTTTGVANNEFVNTYDTSTTAQIKGTKAMTPTTESKEGYSFTLAEVDGAPVSNTTSDANGFFEFGAITYTMAMVKDDNTAVGGVYTKTYSYTVTENLPNDETPTPAEKAAKVAIRDHVKYNIEPKEVTVEVTYNEHTGDMNATVNPAQTELKFTNEKLGALKITKKVTVDGSSDIETPQKQNWTNGDYVFKVVGPTDAVQADQVTKYVRITVNNGVADSYRIADTEEGLTSATQQGGSWAVIPDLSEGDYTVTETNTNGLTLTGVERGDKDSSAVGANKVVTLHVTAGVNDPKVDSAAAATFTNNKVTGKLYIKKTLQVNSSEINDSNKPLANGDFTFKLERKAVPDTATGEDAETFVRYITISIIKGEMTSASWSADPNGDPIMMGDGFFTVEEGALWTGLELGTYKLTEMENTVSDNGYALQLESVTVVGGTKKDIDNGVTFEITEAASTLKVNFTNNLYKNSIKIVKIDETTRGADTPTRLSGAKFQLYKDTAVESGEPNYTVWPNESSCEKTTSSDDDTKGTLTFDNLEDGEYKIHESKTPDGYVKTDANDIYFKLRGGKVTWHTKPDANGQWNPITMGETNLVTYARESDMGTFTVGNNPGARLPSTGGMGTGLIYATGTGLLLLAVIAWVMKAKKRDYGAY